MSTQVPVVSTSESSYMISEQNIWQIRSQTSCRSRQYNIFSRIVIYINQILKKVLNEPYVLFSDDHLCPVKTFLRYKEKRNPMCSALFQRPKTNVTDNSEIWYDNVPVGHNTLGSMMARISRKAGLSRKYTNHSLRATAVNILDKAQFASRHIMSVTGHKAESSLKTY